MATASESRTAGSNPRDVPLWGLRVGWLLLPLLAGPLFGDALHPTDTDFRTPVSVALWALWAIGLVASLLPHPLTLTLIRLLATGAAAAGVWALIEVIGSDDARTGLAIVGVVAVIVAAGIALLPHIAATFVDGESYGDERRLPLKPPAGVLLGPLQVTWLVTIVGLVAGPLLLASRRWTVGTIVTIVGWAVAVFGVRSLHTLARRFLVFVPAGFVLHDLTALTEPVLFRREHVRVVGPAFADSVARDLTLGASGLALEARFHDPLAVPIRPTGSLRDRSANTDAQTEKLRSVLVSPSQPGVVLAEAERRRLPVG